MQQHQWVLDKNLAVTYFHMGKPHTIIDRVVPVRYGRQENMFPKRISRLVDGKL